MMGFIDFDAFNANVEKWPVERMYLMMKFVHGLRPVHHQTNQIYFTRTKCSCGEEETLQHLFECPIYNNIKNDFLKSLEKLRKAKTN